MRKPYIILIYKTIIDLTVLAIVIRKQVFGYNAVCIVFVLFTTNPGSVPKQKDRKSL